ncbi:hypothetical protein NDU88_001329 [Pleurodeles waltl]|uniref:Uncharacterized protein n=1 Tax=Pleurodeles waltl TaxID=8319 RepID=A0AAV7M7W9_PLEWA|nr:hypothetical protein NDU88_001329 [Pleurodeles waltl]
MEQYTTPTSLPQRQTPLGRPGEALEEPSAAGEPTRAELLVAIHGARVALEGKIETVAVEVNLLQTDLHKVSEKVKVAEGAIVYLQTEHAHRALTAPPRPGTPQRAIIACLLNYKDRDCILQTARETDWAVFENRKISIFPDYTNKVQSSQKGFLEVKAKLRAMNIRYMLLYPARLKVISGGKS